MSLLDDVSIVVTPNGYKAGTLYGVLPTAIEGSELVTNGGFATDSDWNKLNGSTISGGVGNVIANGDLGSTGGNWSLNQNVGMVLGKRYKITFQARQTGGTGNFQVAQAYLKGFNQSITSSFVNYSFNITAADWGVDTATLTMGGLTVGDTFEVDNVSVKEYTASDMDVTRVTAATRVDENGLVNYAEVLGSEQVTAFTNGTVYPFTTFTTSGNNITSAIVSSAFAGAVSNSISVTSGEIYKVTFDYTKNSGDDLRIVFSSAVTGAGTQISNNELISVSGTYTKYFTITSTTTGYFQMGTGNSGHSLNASITNISVKEVDRNNVPRIDYTGGGCPHILAEPQRTNLIPYSEAFNSWHTVNNVTITQDTTETTSPSGNNTASKITINSASIPRRVFEVISTSSGSDYTFTLYAKKGTTDYIRLLISSNIYDVAFDLTNGTKTVISGLGSIESVGNDWYKIQGTGTSSLTTEVAQIQLSNSASVNDYLYIWGAQLEVGSYPTSYIPTSGSTVTRNQDIFTRDGIGSLINSTEGVLFVEIAALSDDLTYRILSLSNGTANERIYIQYTNVSNTIAVVVKNGGITQANMVYVLSDETQFSKIAIKWKVNDFAMWVDGVEISTDLSGSVPTGLNRLAFDNSSTTKFFGKVKQLQVYDTALTDMQLIQLTGTAGTDFYESYSEMAETLTYTIQ